MTVEVAVSIVRWADDHFPGFVECKLTDRFAKDWLFILKNAYVHPWDLFSDSQYPQPGTISCRILSTGKDDGGRGFSVVDMEYPWGVQRSWGVETGEGDLTIEVFNDQLMKQT